MPKLPSSLRDWQSEAFAQTFKTEIISLPSGSLPIDKGVAQGGYVDDSNLSVILLSVADDAEVIRARVGIFFTEIVVNCGCGVDPMPTNAYCEIQVIIDRKTAAAEFALLPS